MKELHCRSFIWQELNNSFRSVLVTWLASSLLLDSFLLLLYNKHIEKNLSYISTLSIFFVSLRGSCR